MLVRATAIAPMIMLCVAARLRSGPDSTMRAAAGASGVTRSIGADHGSPDRRSPVVKCQSSAKTARSWPTAGPRIEKCVSRSQGSIGRLRTKPSRMFMPPVKPTRPSTTMILRWLRRFA
jgi:hypothetical protein